MINTDQILYSANITVNRPMTGFMLASSITIKQQLSNGCETVTDLKA